MSRPTCSRRSRSRAQRGARAGFSMIELLGVLAVLGIIATIVTVNWRAILPKTELHAAVRELAAILNGTRSDAIARNSVFQIQYDLDEHRYRVVTPFKAGGGLALTDEERAAGPWHVLPDTVRMKSIGLDGEDYVKGIVWVRFDPLGSASGHTIVLEQPSLGNLYTIEVQALLGLVNYHEGLFVRQPPEERDFE